jgi:sugar fermentation stimulation protein A
VKHLQELTHLAQSGYGAYVLFVIQMDDVVHLHPNDTTDPAFGKALRQAAAAGVQVLAVDCRIEPDSMTLRKPVPVIF